MKCRKCNKPLKEDTEGNKRYCQGHLLIEQIVQQEHKDLEESLRKFGDEE